jgi:hypothetical protein
MEYPDVHYPNPTPNVEGDMPSRSRAARLVDGQGKAWMVDAEPAGHGDTFGNFDFPFKVKDGSNPDDGTRVSVLFGVVTDFWDSFAPPSMNMANDPLFYVSVTATGVIYVEVEVETDLADPDYGKIITVNDPVYGATVPANDYGAGLFYIYLANIVAVDGTNFTVTAFQVWGGSFGFLLAGEAGMFWSLGP